MSASLAESLEPGDRVMTSLGRTGTFVRHGQTHGCVYILFDGDAEPSSTALRHLVATEEVR